MDVLKNNKQQGKPYLSCSAGSNDFPGAKVDQPSFQNNLTYQRAFLINLKEYCKSKNRWDGKKTRSAGV